MQSEKCSSLRLAQRYAYIVRSVLRNTLEPFAELAFVYKEQHFRRTVPVRSTLRLKLMDDRFGGTFDSPLK